MILLKELATIVAIITAPEKSCSTAQQSISSLGAMDAEVMAGRAHVETACVEDDQSEPVEAEEKPDIEVGFEADEVTS